MKLINNIAIPVHILHSTGKYVLKDFKPQNVLITSDGLITMVDMDSIQIAEGNKILFPGTAATPDYMPPEFYQKGIGRTVDDVITPSWDTFALGVVFYQLLFGIHPYAATPRNLQEDSTNDISHNIATGLFPFGVNGDMVKVRPVLHNNFMQLPDEFQKLFIRTFSDNLKQRPTAEEWGKYVYQEICKANIPEPLIPEPLISEPLISEPPISESTEKKKNLWAWVLGLAAIVIVCFFIFKNSSNPSSEIETFYSEQNDSIEEVDDGKIIYEKAMQKENISKRYEYIIAAANMGYAPAQFELGKMYNFGDGQKVNYSKAVSWYQKAIDQGNADAMAYMSDLYVEGNGVEKDYEKALQLIRKSADQNNGYGLNNLGFMYRKGYAVSQNNEEALKFYRKSADMDNEWGLNSMGDMYFYGYGVSQDYNEAIKYFRKSADLGQPRGMVNLAYMLVEGKGVKQDYAEAFRLYEETAQKGNSLAMVELGNMYKYGHGVKKDYQEAMKWYRKALEKDNVSSMNYIGLMYFDGFGVSEDKTEAHKWFLKAAKRDNSSGMYNVGHDYFYGYGVDKNLQKAKEWLNKASTNGNEGAKELLAQIDEEESRSNNQSDQYSQNPESNSSVSETNEFVVDGITYSYAAPTGSQMSSWKSKYKSTCASKIRNKMSGYSISDDMVSNDPCLVYLILQAKSLDGNKDKQDWFNLYEAMNEEQINRLYDILYRECYKLAKIEYDYQKKREVINQKYK